MAASRTGLAFVGRGEELRALAAALGAGPAVVLVEGEAGIGKSRLVSEALAALGPDDGIPVLRGWCHPLREPAPFGPVVDALRDGLTRIPPDVELGAASGILAARFASEPTEAAAGAGGQQLMRAVHDVLAAIGPAVLVVEDVHWADDATRELLLLLARTPPPHLRLIVTYRRGDLPHGTAVFGSPYYRPTGVGGQDISLHPLDQAQVQQLAAGVLGKPAAHTLGRQLFERSAGLPLIAEEDLLALAATSRRPAEPSVHVVEGLAAPRALKEAVGARLAGLDVVAVAAVQAAAVLAVPATEELLAAVARLDEDDAEAGLTEALDASILEETLPGRYGFRHVLARQAIYEKIPGPRRRRLHQRAIDALDTGPDPPLVQIAHHTRQLGDPHAWIPRAQAAADHATRIGDDGIATQLLQQLLAEPTLPTQQRTTTALTLAHIAADRLELTTTITALRTIVADPSLPTAVRGEIRLNLARALLTHSSEPKNWREMERAIEELDSRPDLAATAMAGLGTGTDSASVAQDIAWMERAVHTVARTDDPLAHATVLASRITLLETLGDPAARQLLEQLPRLDENRGVQRQCCRALHNAADEAMWRADDPRARSLLDEAVELAARARNQQLAAGCESIRLNLDFADGLWDGLDERLESIAPEADQAGGMFEVEPMLIRAQLDLARGHWARARERLTALLETTSHGFVPWHLVAAANMSRLDLAEAAPVPAWECLQPALHRLRTKDNWVWAVDLVPSAVQAALACGLRQEAEELLREVLQGIQGRDTPGVQAEALWSQGLLATPNTPEEAIGLLEQARSRFEALGRVHQAAQVAEHTGHAYLAAHPDDPGRAARSFQDALNTYTRLGAAADQARCQHMLREGDNRPPATRRPRSHADELSPRERQVADLLTTGASNQDIARALSLSVRTVEHHVAHTLKKLRTTRHDLHHPTAT
ncbi:ATP-binding protein [Kitasatospora sp. NPDC088346]|uniref:ATP-binding protein n=1 Tax=Kitasatospora sp. NPDC088346 TaxID=3364073 RepID=UPI0038293A9D